MNWKPFFLRQNRNVAALLIVLLWLVQCPASLAQSSPGRHSFYQEKAARHASAADTVRLYFDRAGSLYPMPGYLPDNKFDEQQYKQLLTMWYYDPAHRPQLDALSKQCGVANFAVGANWWDHWWKIQQALAQRAAAQLDRLTGSSRPTRRPLITLIHGFNTRADEEPYDTTRNVLRREPALRSAVWLEVYWDGLHKPLRIFTHSSGAIVASQALWNSTPVAKDDQQLLWLASHIPTPTNADVRAGMIVPAMTPLAYMGYEKGTTGTPDNPASCRVVVTKPRYHIVLGQNARDYAVTKQGRAANLEGVTTLGCWESAFDLARQNCHDCDLKRVEFSRVKSGPSPPPFSHRFLGKDLEKHAWGLYWLRHPQDREFLDLVLK